MQAHPFMEREGRIPPGLVVGLIVFVLVIGALAYYTGRFGRRGPAVSPVENLPAPGAPAPAVAENVPTPADIPPTVTPSLPVVETSSRSTRVLVEKSTQITVPVAPPATTPRPGAVLRPTPTPDDAARRRIVMEIVNTPPPPLPSPTVPELERGNEEPPEEPPEEPEPEPTPGRPGQAGGRPVSI